MLTSKIVNRLPVLEFSLLYGAGTGLWLLVSNRLLPEAIPDVNRLASVQTLLDFSYAVLSLVVFYFLLRRTARLSERTNRALADERNLLRTLIDNLPDYIFVKDRECRFVINNVAHVRQLKLQNQSDAIGKTDFDFHPTELATQYHADELAIFRTGEALINHEEPALDHLDHRLWVQTTKVPLRDSLGTIIGLVGIVHDITEVRRANEALHRSYDVLERRVEERTAALSAANMMLREEIAERKQAQETLRKSEELYRTLARNFPNGAVTLFDRELRYTLVEGAGLDLLGRSKMELEGKTVQEVFPQRSAILEPSYRAVFEGITSSYETVSEGRAALVYILPVKNDAGEIFAGMVMSLDITERKQMEQALRTSRDELEIRVKERTAALSTSNAQLQAEIGERQRIEQMEHEQRVLAEALRDTAAALNSTLNLDEVLDRILINVRRVVEHDQSNVMLIENKVARIVRHRGYEMLGEDIRQQMEALRFPVDETPEAIEMQATGKPVIIDDVRLRPGWRGTWVTSYVGAPIRVGQAIIGFLDLDASTPGFFTEIDAERLQAFADQAAIAIQNARLYSQAQALAAMQERQRLARELHDAVSQTLFSANVIAESLPRLMTRDQEKAERGLAHLHQLTRSALAEMRALLLELQPTELVKTDLSDLLRQLTESVIGRTTTIISLSAEAVGPLPADAQVAMYRIAQETINNSLRHAHADRIIIKLSNTVDRVEIHISDDGLGFDPTAAHPGHLGLGIMTERAREIGATLMITSQAGRGTEIALSWPKPG